MTAYFDSLPDELLLMIYEWAPVCMPMLRKVNWRWRNLLASMDIYYPAYYANWAAAEGYRVNLGKITHREIKYFIGMHFIDLIMRAGYTWQNCTRDTYVLKYIYESCFHHLNQHEKYRPTDVMKTLIFKYDHITSNQNNELMLENMLIRLDNIELVEFACILGRSFKKCWVDRAQSFEMMQKLHKDMGCAMGIGILRGLINRKWGAETWYVYSDCEKMIEYVIKNGCILADKDVELAAKLHDVTTIELVHAAGYTFKQELFTKTSDYMEKFIRRLTK